jgi:hypothetical protein
MSGLRKLVALGMCLWLLLSGGAAYALASLEAEHEQEHMAAGQQVHDAANHHHADTGLELFSQFFDQPGFEQLTSAWIAARSPVTAHDTCSSAPAYLGVGSRSATPLPPPGPPPRAIALNRGGGFSR